MARPALPVLEGFTLRNGAICNDCGDTRSPSPTGSVGVTIQGASPTIRNNVITENVIGRSGYGGGISAHFGGSPLIEGNVISHNSDFIGGGADIGSDGTVLRNNVIEDNQAGLSGGGISIGADNVTVEGNVVRRNAADNGAGMSIGSSPFSSAGETIVAGNLVVDNRGFTSPGIEAGALAPTSTTPSRGTAGSSRTVSRAGPSSSRSH